MVYGFVEDICFKEKKDNGVNIDYIFEILFRNKENLVYIIFVFLNGFICIDFNGNFIYFYEIYLNG